MVRLHLGGKVYKLLNSSYSMKKYLIGMVAGIGLVSGCASSQRDVVFGEYSMSQSGYDYIERFAREADEELNYEEMIHFCERKDSDGDKFLSDSEVEKGLESLIVKVSH